MKAPFLLIENFIFEDSRERQGVRDLTGSFFRKFAKNGHPGKLHCTLDSLKKLALLALLKEVKPSPDS